MIKAKGEAESILIRGDALKQNPTFVELQIIDQWDGVTPLVIGGSDKLVMPLRDLQQSRNHGTTQ